MKLSAVLLFNCQRVEYKLRIYTISTDITQMTITLMGMMLLLQSKIFVTERVNAVDEKIARMTGVLLAQMHNV